MRKKQLEPILVVAFFVATAAHADVEVLSPAKDNTLIEWNDLTNCAATSGHRSSGSGGSVFAGRTNQGSGSDRRRAVMQFDVSSIPSGSTVNSVTLTLEMTGSNETSGVGVSLHEVLADWGEGASVGCGGGGGGGGGCCAEANDATWVHTFYSGSSWSSSGGDYDATASATTTVAGTGAYTWGSTSQMVTDVQDWVDGANPNYGWILIGDESAAPTAKRFDSREGTTPPSLSIDFTPPAGTGACCFSDGSCTVGTSGDCSSAGGSYEGDGTSCSPNPCPQPVGACCALDESCTIQTEDDCGAAGGFYQGDGTNCAGNPCLGLSGACCLSGAVCEVKTPANCAIQGGVFQGQDVACASDLCPLDLEPFVDLLPMPPVAIPVSGIPGGAATYHIPIVEFDQQLHRDLAPTRVWGYGGSTPGPVIEARTGLPVSVRWINNLRDEDGNLRTSHYLPVDTCPHGADDDSPRTVVHLHGGHTPSIYDGDPEDTVVPEPALAAYNDYTYPNNQMAATLWFHDHALGITRLNVYMGLAGLYIIRDDFEDALDLPDDMYEIPLVVQDRCFNLDGTLDYPVAWQDQYFGEYVMVNGKVWPFLPVDQGKYRFRIVNGSNARTYTFWLDDGTGTPATFWQIGTDGGLVPMPVALTELMLAPGERADVVMDFAGYNQGDEIVLSNSGAASALCNGAAEAVVNVMQFRVTGLTGYTTALPSTLRELDELSLADVVEARELRLDKEDEVCAGTHWLINGLKWDDITELPTMGTTELWKFVNLTGAAHPMHLHLDFHQILGRQEFELVDDEVVLLGSMSPPALNEIGWKDTSRADPGEVLFILAHFPEYTGRYPYHCHILEHEDHEMMRQFEVVLPCPGDCGNANGSVGIADFLAVLSQWGMIGTACDFDNNGVDIVDFLAVLSYWGDCPP